MSTMYSVGQMNQLGDALEAAGFTPDDVTKLRSFSQLGEFNNVLKGNAMIALVKHDRRVPIPFGPYLAGGGLVALFFGADLTQAYLAQF